MQHEQATQTPQVATTPDRQSSRAPDGQDLLGNAELADRAGSGTGGKAAPRCPPIDGTPTDRARAVHHLLQAPLFGWMSAAEADPLCPLAGLGVPGLVALRERYEGLYVVAIEDDFLVYGGETVGHEALELLWPAMDREARGRARRLWLGGQLGPGVTGGAPPAGQPLGLAGLRELDPAFEAELTALSGELVAFREQAVTALDHAGVAEAQGDFLQDTLVGLDLGAVWLQLRDLAALETAIVGEDDYSAATLSGWLRLSTALLTVGLPPLLAEAAERDPELVEVLAGLEGWGEALAARVQALEAHPLIAGGRSARAEEREAVAADEAHERQVAMLREAVDAAWQGDSLPAQLGAMWGEALAQRLVLEEGLSAEQVRALLDRVQAEDPELADRAYLEGGLVLALQARGQDGFTDAHKGTGEGFWSGFARTRSELDPQFEAPEVTETLGQAAAFAGGMTAGFFEGVGLAIFDEVKGLYDLVTNLPELWDLVWTQLPALFEDPALRFAMGQALAEAHAAQLGELADEDPFGFGRQLGNWAGYAAVTAALMCVGLGELALGLEATRVGGKVADTLGDTLGPLVEVAVQSRAASAVGQVVLDLAEPLARTRARVDELAAVVAGGWQAELVRLERADVLLDAAEEAQAAGRLAEAQQAWGEAERLSLQVEEVVEPAVAASKAEAQAARAANFRQLQDSVIGRPPPANPPEGYVYRYAEGSDPPVLVQIARLEADDSQHAALTLDDDGLVAWGGRGRATVSERNRARYVRDPETGRPVKLDTQGAAIEEEVAAPLLKERSEAMAERDRLQAVGDREGARKAQGQANKATEQLGIEGGRAFVEARHPGAELVYEGGGTGTFDLVYRVPGEPDRWVVIEAKGGSGSNSSSRMVDRQRYQQGHPDYARGILEAMGERGKLDDETLLGLRQAIRQDALEYLEVRQRLSGEGELGTLSAKQYEMTPREMQ